MATSSVPPPSFIRFAFALPEIYSILFIEPSGTVIVTSDERSSSGTFSTSCAETADAATATNAVNNLSFIAILLFCSVSFDHNLTRLERTADAYVLPVRNPELDSLRIIGCVDG